MNNIWERSGESTMSKNLYVLNFSMFTALGILASFFVARFTLHMNIGLIGALVVLALGIVGVVMAKKSSNPLVSLTGYMMVAIPYGALLGPFINEIAGPAAKTYLGFPITSDIVTALFVTTAYVVVFGIVGTVIPDSLDSWLNPIIGLLTVGIVGYFVIPLGGFFGLNITHALDFWDWAVVALFAFIIMFDFNRAMRIPYTLDNAIDVALEIYLDWFNVFVRVVRFLANKNKND